MSQKGKVPISALRVFNLGWRRSELLLLLLFSSGEVSVPTNGQSVVLAFWDYLFWRPEAFLDRIGGWCDGVAVNSI
jgi:hypothetical protein